MNFCLTQSKLCGLVVFAMSLLVTDFAEAQCSTCATPTVAYQPVTYQAAQPVVAYRPYDRWYLGRALDRWRSRGLSRTVPTYTTAAYSPYTASYVPYTAAYAPAAYTAAYRPYTVGYASYARPYVTSYAPLTPTCTSCAQTVARPVVLQPSVTTSCSACGCDPCCCASPCTSCAGACDSCSVSTVTQATYSEPACSSCAASSTYSAPTSSPAPSVGQQTPQPQLEPTPSNSIYQSNRPEGQPSPAPAQDPGPVDSSTYDLRAPKLLDPSDRTAFHNGAKGTTVDVWNTVYKKPVVSQSVNKVSYQAPSQEQIDAQGWNAVGP